MNSRESTTARRAFVALSFFILAIGICHLRYLSSSQMPPSTDEAHYMSGALSIAEGVRTHTLSGAWHGYLAALGFKAPLVCVPAAGLMLATGQLVLPCFLSLLLTCIAVGFASYSLFRHLFSPWYAAASSSLLITMPMVTGLTHRFYVELLLLLLVVVYLDLLARRPWKRLLLSIAVGCVLGLGLLCKVTFAAIIALPTAYSLLVTFREAGPRGIRGILRLFATASLAVLTAVAVAGPWYSHNLHGVIEHSKIAFSAKSCYYAGWFLANISTGPYFPIWCVSVVGLGAVAYAVLRRRLEGQAAEAWTLVLLSGAATWLATMGSIAKVTRYSVTWLPAIAALAVAAPALTVRSGIVARSVTVAMIVVSCVLFLHNCFEVLPIGPVRLGDITVLSSRFPLNVPGWYDDNHPLDRRDFRVAEVEDVVARDAAVRLQAGETIRVRLTEVGLLFNFDYLALLASAHKHAVHYSWWPGTVTAGPDAPDYIVHYKGFEKLYPGIHFFHHYPDIEADVASGRVQYQLAARLDSAAGTSIFIYRRPVLTSKALSQQAFRLFIEAEHFARGDVTVDTGQLGYGAGIGVIVSPRPPSFAEYDFQVPVSGPYQLELRYASAVPRPVRVLVDGEIFATNAAGGATGGFAPENQRWQPVGAVFLESGEHTLRLDSGSVLPCIDRLLVAFASDSVPLSAPRPTRSRAAAQPGPARTEPPRK